MPIRWNEPFGMVMVEALACGTPVIAFPEGAARELVIDGQTGFLVDDERAMARGRRPAGADRCAGLPSLGGRALRRRRRRRRLRAHLSSVAQRSSAVARACLSGPSASWTAARSSSAIASATSAPTTGREHGFFSDDTRFLSRWVLRVGETPLELLSLDQSAHFDAQFFLTPRVGPDEEAPCSIMRRRLVDHVWMEEVSVTNHRHERAAMPVVAGGRRRLRRPVRGQGRAVAQRDVRRSHDDRRSRCAIERAGFQRSVTIAASAPAAVTRDRLRLRAGPRARRAVVDDASRSRPTPRSRASPSRGASAPGGFEQLSAPRSAELEDVAGPSAGAAGRRPGAGAHLPREPQRSRRACACTPTSPSDATLPPAGLPWFMALFGRDSLITSFQALPYLPGLAATTLRVLAARQAHAARRLPRAGARQDPARAALRRAHRARRAPALAVLRDRRRHAAVPGPARRVPPLVRRRRPRPRRSSPTPARPWPGSRTAATPTAMATSSTNAATRPPASSTSAGRTAGTRSSSPTARSRGDRSRPARSRATSTTRSAAIGAAGARGLARPRARRALEHRADDLRARSGATSGCPSAAATRSRSTATNARSTA